MQIKYSGGGAGVVFVALRHVVAFDRCVRVSFCKLYSKKKKEESRGEGGKVERRESVSKKKMENS